MKKTIIIMGSLVLVAVIALTLVIALKPKRQQNVPIEGRLDMTFEMFTKSMKEDLSNETMDKVEELYKKFEKGDMKVKAEVLKELREMGVYKDDAQGMASGARTITKEQLEEIMERQKNGD